jgi:hypothetical protein
MFCLMNEQTGELVIEPTLIGEITNDQTDLYTELCKEKANRLRENIKEHKLSWQSRNEDEEKWGGAISDGDHIWSFSGLTEAQDEALMIMGAHTCGRIMNYLPEALANLSDNRIILDGPLHFWVTRYEYEEDEDGEEPTATSAATS